MILDFWWFLVRSKVRAFTACCPQQYANLAVALLAKVACWGFPCLFITSIVIHCRYWSRCTKDGLSCCLQPAEFGCLGCCLAPPDLCRLITGCLLDIGQLFSEWLCPNPSKAEETLHKNMLIQKLFLDRIQPVLIHVLANDSQRWTSKLLMKTFQMTIDFNAIVYVNFINIRNGVHLNHVMI